MADGFQVDAAQLHRHAAKVKAVQDQLAAIRGASRAITRNDQAYGLLCGWIAGILEARHVRQDSLYAYVDENLSLAAQALTTTARQYEVADTAASDRIRQAGRVG